MTDSKIKETSRRYIIYNNRNVFMLYVDLLEFPSFMSKQWSEFPFFI